MKLRLVAALGLSAALLLTACGDGNGTDTAAPEDTAVEETAAPEETTEETEEPGDETEEPGDETAGGDLSGELRGMGASSMRVSQEAWLAAFMDENPGVTVSYAAEGSGAGRGAMEDGSAEFGGSDAAYAVDENVAGAFGACSADAALMNLPVYVSPIAVIFQLDGVDELNLDAQTVASIFKGDIIQWNDPAIAATNEGVELPDLPINAVHRGDKSGTTGNFLAYLEAAAPDVWTHGTDDQFPSDLGGEAANQTAGVAAAVAAGEGSIGYLDASAVGDMQTVAVKSGNDFVPYSPEAAAAVVAGSPLEEGRADTDVVFDLDYTGVEGAYPIVLVAYLIGCSEYTDSNVGAMVKDYFTYVASAEGQEAAAAEAGNAPLSDEIREQAMAAIDQIK